MPDTLGESQNAPALSPNTKAMQNRRRRPSISMTAEDVLYANKICEVLGVEGEWAGKLNGLYKQLIEKHNGFMCYHNKETGAYLMRDDEHPVWKATVDLHGENDGLISVADDVVHPWDVGKIWNIHGSDGSATASFKIKVALRREEVLIGGREGFNCRLNGVFEEMPTDYYGYPSYHDDDGNAFLYRDPHKAAWIVSNRIGKPLRNRPRAIFALNPDPDASRPYEAKCVWQVQAWGPHESCSDPDVTVKLRDSNDLEPPQYTVVKSRKHLNCSGGFELVAGESSAGMPVWKHEPEPGRNLEEMWLFFNGHCWLIAKDMSVSQNNAGTTSKGKAGKRLPDECCWAEAIVRTVKSASTFTFEPAEGKRWRDEAFHSGIDALGDVMTARGIDPAEVVWAQASDVLDGEVCVIDSIGPEDCASEHGALWLSAALACVAEFPGVLDALFVTNELVHDGHYVLKLWDLNTRTWQYVEINDMIPCFQRRPWEPHPMPVFAQTEGAEMWTMLMEKAFAKLAGSYAALKGGNTGLALQALCGIPEMWTYERQDDGLWHKMLSEGARGTPRDFLTMNHLEQNDEKGPLTDLEMALALVGFDDKNYVMAAVIPSDQRVVTPDGLVTMCAYSLTSAKTFPQAFLVKLRNPLGRNVGAEWSGRWSNSDATVWVNNPEVSEACFGSDWRLELMDHNHPFDSGSPFWMDFGDFADRFKQIIVGPLSLGK